MRFTIKAKLATTFGLVIALSVISGGVAYYELGELESSQQTVISQGQRVAKIGDLQIELQAQIRSEKDAMLATTDKAIEAAAAEMLIHRENATRITGELYSIDEIGRAHV